MTIQIIEQSELRGGNFEGYLHGSEISVIFEHEDRIGAGPRLHQHPYSETFVLRRGAALFTVGDERLEAVGGQILVVPAFTPHKFEKIGDETQVFPAPLRVWCTGGWPDDVVAIGTISRTARAVVLAPEQKLNRVIPRADILLALLLVERYQQIAR